MLRVLKCSCEFAERFRKLNQSRFHTFLMLSALTLVALLGAKAVFAENIDPFDDGSQYAYGENVGWLNAEPLGDQGPGVTVGTLSLTGYIWAENIGWVNLSCENASSCSSVDFGIVNDGLGNLTGYAWAENAGWISFSCENTNTCDSVVYGVMIDPLTGGFSGRAWGENIGWVTLSADEPVSYGVKTSWIATVYLCEGDSEPDGDVDGTDLVEEINAGGSNVDQFATDFGRTDCPGVY